MLIRYAAPVFTVLVFATSARAENAANTDIDLDFSIVTGLKGGPTSYLDGIKEMHWVLALTNKGGLDEQRLRASAKRTFTKSKLGFVRVVKKHHHDPEKGCPALDARWAPFPACAKPLALVIVLLDVSAGEGR